jgi:hypothetical protein
VGSSRTLRGSHRRCRSLITRAEEASLLPFNAPAPLTAAAQTPIERLTTRRTRRGSSSVAAWTRSLRLRRPDEPGGSPHLETRRQTIVRLPLPPPPRFGPREGSGMEGTLSSTGYRGLPFIGGQPLPRHVTPWRARGVRGPRYPSTRVRVVGPSEPSREVSAGDALSGVLPGTGIP